MRKKPVSAGRLADMAVCEVQAVLKARHQQQHPKASKEKIKKGNMAHRKDEAAVRNLQRQACFIATCVYGGDAVETQKLRHYRDTQLLPTLSGRIFIRAYYRISPLFVRLLRAHPLLLKYTQTQLNRLVSKL